MSISQSSPIRSSNFAEWRHLELRVRGRQLNNRAHRFLGLRGVLTCAQLQPTQRDTPQGTRLFRGQSWENNWSYTLKTAEVAGISSNYLSIRGGFRGVLSESP